MSLDPTILCTLTPAFIADAHDGDLAQAQPTLCDTVEEAVDHVRADAQVHGETAWREGDEIWVSTSDRHATNPKRSKMLAAHIWFLTG